MFLLTPTAIGAGLDDLTTLTKSAQQLIAALSAFFTAALGGVLLAWHKIRRESSPEKKEEANDTALASKMDELEKNAAAEKKDREKVDQETADRLNQLQDDLGGVRDDVREIRTLVQRILGKMAGI